MTLACSSRETQNREEPGPSVQKKEITLPDIPAILTAPLDRANYLIEHYWDHFDFRDTLYTHLPGITEQAFADYIYTLPHANKNKAVTEIKNLLKKAEAEKTGSMYRYFLTLFDKYVRDPNSPLRNEEFYIPVAEYIISDNRSDEAEKERAKFRMEIMLKNRVGEPASDFAYTLASGKTGTLYQIQADYILLLFYNPDCHACAEVIETIKTSTDIQLAKERKKLKILAFYPDKDLEIWKKHLADIPSDWTNGYDREQVVENTRLYDLKAIPSLYLLDRDKQVILKDADIRTVEEKLPSLLQGTNLTPR
jgi:hypothetical protein